MSNKFCNNILLFIFVIIFLGIFNNIQCQEEIPKDYLHHIRIKYDFSFVEAPSSLKLIERTLEKTKKIISELFLIEKIDTLLDNINTYNCRLNAKNVSDNSSDLIVFIEVNNTSQHFVEKEVCFVSFLRKMVFAKFSFNIIKIEKFLKTPENLHLFENEVLKTYFFVLGFNKKFLKRHYLPTNIFEVHDFYTFDLNHRWSIEKYYYLAKKKEFKNTYSKAPITVTPYEISWPKEYGIPDIMSNFNSEYPTISELTMNLFDEFRYNKRNQCDLEFSKSPISKKYKKCTRIDQKCPGRLERFFLHYETVERNNNTEVICYLDSRSNIMNKTCGIRTGRLMFDKLDFCYNKMNKTIMSFKDRIITNKKKYKYEIPELNLMKNQSVTLLSFTNNNSYNYPRTLFFLDKMDNRNFNDVKKEYLEKGIKLEKMSIDDRKYFVTYRTIDFLNTYDLVIKAININNLIRTYINSLNNLLLTSNKYLLKSAKILTQKEISRYVKISFIPMFQDITHKNLLHKTFKEFQKKYEKYYNYMVETYIYPDDREIINTKFQTYILNDSLNLWLLKPYNSLRGYGIRFFKNLTQISDKKLIITKYIPNPHLLFGYKYDLRVYVLVTSIAPLKIYVFSEGLVRLATNPYNLDLNKIDDYFSHLTNVALNKKNYGKYKYNTNHLGYDSNKWSFQAYEKYLTLRNPENPDLYKEIRKSYIDKIIKTIIMIKNNCFDYIKKSNYHFSNFYQIFGFDIFVDEDYNTYLLEVNSDPDFNIYDDVDKYMKSSLYTDALNIIGLVPFSNDKMHEPLDKDMVENKNDEVFLDVVESITEFKRPLGRYERVFPLKENIEKYKEFFGKKIDLRNKWLWDFIDKNITKRKNLI